MEIVYRSGGAAALWKPELLPLYLLHGEEDRLKEEAVAALTRHLVAPDFADFDLEVMHTSNATADTILAAAGQIPFGSDRRLVLVKGLEQWRERNKQSEAERLAAGLSRLSNTVCLVLMASAEEEEGRRKTIITTKLDNAVRKVGATVSCPALKGEGLSGWVAARVRQEGKRIAPEAIGLLTQTVGNEMRVLEQEILKLVCFAGDRETVTGLDVGKVVASSPEDVMFTAIDAITRRQTDRALTLLAELHRYDPKPQAVAGKLLALLARQYRMLWQAKFLAERRVSPRDVRALPPELAAELPGESNIAQLAFKAADLFAASRSYAWSDLTRAMESLLLCDLANKGGVTDETGAYSSDPAGNLQLLVLELTGATNKKK